MPPARLWIDTFEIEDTAVVACCGELEISTAPALELRLRAAALASFRQVVVDMRDVTFMDACGLRALVRAGEAADAAGVRLTVRNAKPAVRMVLEMTRHGAALAA
jgi:anti-sigma B factor antagonist